MTPAPHEGLHHQISNAFIRFVVEPEATPGTNYRACTKWPSGATLAGFFCKGRDAGSFRSGCIHGTSCGAAPYASHESIRFVTASHLTSNIINHQPSTFHAFRFFFPIYHVILFSFHVKNGSFQSIQIHTGALLAPLPQIALFFHYNR